MTKHQKRLSVPKSWPVERKTATWTAKAAAGPHGEAGVPLLVVLRDVLGYVESAKEAKYALNIGGVLVNGDSPSSINRPIGMFDILAFPERDEYYRVFPDEGGRLGLTPIEADAADSKLGKIENKTIVDGGRTQLNLHDGQNLVVEDGDEYSGGDSIVVDNETNEVVAHFVYEEGALVTAVAGQHAGEVGTIEHIEVAPGSAKNTVRVEKREASETPQSDGEAVENEDGEFETIEDYVVVIDEKFTGGSDSGTESEPRQAESDGGED